MKDYRRKDRDGRLKPEKKKKRKFEVIIKTATHGIYTDFTPMKVAKKVTSNLVGKKKQIIFHLREKGKSGKLYGAYIGNIQDGKVVVRIHKMSGGEMGCVFNRISPNNFKVDKSDSNNPPKIAITKFCVTKATIIFFCTVGQTFLEKKGNKYYTHAIYREGKQVLLKKLSYDTKNELIATPIKIENIALDNIQERKEILGEIKKAIKNKRKELQKDNFAKEIYDAINQYLTKTPEQQDHSSIKKEIPIPIAEMTPQMIQKEFNKVKFHPNARSALLPNPTLSPQLNKNELIDPYICPIDNSSIQEFNVSNYGEIFFGFDIDLLKTQPPPVKLYYKYSYRGEKFYQLVKDQKEKLDEKNIQISDVSYYDLLCLYEFAKDVKDKNSDLYKKLLEKIISYKNPNITISLSKDQFNPLENKNFNKKQARVHTNIGKTKKTYGRKTYYFFGKNADNENRYKYACYRDGAEVFYFEIGNPKQRKNLMDLQDKEALEDLKSFIILRRMKNPDDPKFGEEVIKKATQRIGELKFKEIKDKSTQSTQSKQSTLSTQSKLTTPLPISPPQKNKLKI